MAQPPPPHVLLIPYPAQGHVTPFTALASALLHARGGGIHVTFVHTDHNRRRLLRSHGPAALSSPNNDGRLRFETIPDGLPPSELDATQDIWRLAEATRRACPAHVRDLLRRLNGSTGSSSSRPPVSCVVADGAMGFVAHVAKEMRLPAYLFFTQSACGLLGYLHFGQLVRRGLVPFKDESCFSDGYLDTAVDWIPGMARGLRLRDLPTFIRTTDPDDVMLAVNIKRCELDAPAAHGILLNTFADLERAALDAIRARLPNTFALGPLASPSPPSPFASSSLWKEDERCGAWLDAQRAGSVVYVNFGSITVLTKAQVAELAWGLAGAGFPFLWVLRPDMVIRDAEDHDKIPPLLPEGFEKEVAARGLVVGWCEQEAVLRHGATGLFLSHCGWNSTVESVRAGVPMLCWPYFSEQVTNCRYACGEDEWGVGVELREVRRGEVEDAVREMMGDGERAARVRRRAAEWKEKAARAVADGGSSRRDLERFLDEIAPPARAASV